MFNDVTVVTAKKYKKVLVCLGTYVYLVTYFFFLPEVSHVVRPKVVLATNSLSLDLDEIFTKTAYKEVIVSPHSDMLIRRRRRGKSFLCTIFF